MGKDYGRAIRSPIIGPVARPATDREIGIWGQIYRSAVRSAIGEPHHPKLVLGIVVSIVQRRRHIAGIFYDEGNGIAVRCPFEALNIGRLIGESLPDAPVGRDDPYIADSGGRGQIGNLVPIGRPLRPRVIRRRRQKCSDGGAVQIGDHVFGQILVVIKVDALDSEEQSGTVGGEGNIRQVLDCETTLWRPALLRQYRQRQKAADKHSQTKAFQFSHKMFPVRNFHGSAAIFRSNRRHAIANTSQCGASKLGPSLLL